MEGGSLDWIRKVSKLKTRNNHEVLEDSSHLFRLLANNFQIRSYAETERCSLVPLPVELLSMG